MKIFTLKRETLTAEQMITKLKERGVLFNRYAEEYIAHPHFSAGKPGEVTAAVVTLRELGLEEGATLEQLFQHIRTTRFRPCPPDTAFFLRLAWTDQPQSENAVLTGTHHSPDRAVMVFSEALEADDSFPKGLYLRRLGSDLWLRGYVCDSEYRFPGDALFAFEVSMTRASDSGPSER